MSRKAVPIFCGISVGFVVLLILAIVLQVKEPWDAVGNDAKILPVLLIIVGFCACPIFRTRFRYFAAGLYLGQLGYYVSFSGLGPLVLLGLIACAIYTLLAVVGGALFKVLFKPFDS